MKIQMLGDEHAAEISAYESTVRMKVVVHPDMYSFTSGEFTYAFTVQGETLFLSPNCFNSQQREELKKIKPFVAITQLWGKHYCTRSFVELTTLTQIPECLLERFDTKFFETAEAARLAVLRL